MRRFAILLAIAVASGCDEGNPLTGFTPANLPASQLAFTVQPSNVISGEAISPPVQVQVRNANGQLVNGSAAAVTMSITAATGTPGATLSGQLVVNAVAGVAIFNNLRINQPGTGYTLTATAPGLTNATSATFDVTLP